MKNINRLLENGKLPKSLIFVCKSENYELEHIVKSLICTETKTGHFCDKCNSCTTFAAGSNPDFFKLGADAGIKVDDVRKLKLEAHIRPILSANKVFFLCNVEKMTREAQNALLKVFEEPPPHLFIVLQTEQPEALLPTILSRAICFYLDDEMAPRDAEFFKLCKELVIAVEKQDLYKALTYAPIISKSRDNFSNAIQALHHLSHDILAQNAGANAAGLAVSSRTAQRLARVSSKYGKSMDYNASLPLLATAFVIELLGETESISIRKN